MDSQEEIDQLILRQPEHLNRCLRTRDKVVLFLTDEIYELEKGKDEKEVVTFTKHQMKEYPRYEGEEGKEMFFHQVYGIIQLQVKLFLVLVTRSERVGEVKGYPIYKVTETKFIEIGTENKPEPLLSALKDSFKILDFYYSQYDLTQRLQFSYCRPAYYEHSFFSNYKYTLDYDNFPMKLLTKFIFGYAATKTVRRDTAVYKFSLISRGNFNSHGRRWLRRGINQQGHCSNHYQTECILEIETLQKTTVYSFMQFRGSLPHLWLQKPNFSYIAPMVISKDFEKIQNELQLYLQRCEQLQKKIVIVNLMDKTDSEGTLGQSFQIYMQNHPRDLTTLVWFDYHQEYRQYKQESFEHLNEIIRPELNDFGFFKMEKRANDYEFQVMKEQQGIIRTNCVDCLDRSNHIQMLIAKVSMLKIMNDFINRNQEFYFPFQKFESQELETAFKQLWRENAIAISRQSTGHAAMKLDFYENGRRTIGGLIHDAVIGTMRFYTGSFSDYYFQNCLDLHFKRLNVLKDAQNIKGSWKKTIGLAASIAAVAGLSYGVYRLVRENIEDSAKKTILSVQLSVLTSLIGLSLIKHNSDTFIQKPIISGDNL